MKSKFAIILTALLINFASSTSPIPPSPVTEKELLGCWEKRYFIQDGVSNSDPRWTLKIYFEKNGKFTYESASTQEVWLSGSGKTSTESRITTMKLTGKI
jgi:hypothetical protein